MTTSNPRLIVRFLLTVVAVILCLGTANGQAEERKSIIVKKDPALDALISPDAQLEKIAGGLGSPEGAPRVLWVEAAAVFFPGSRATSNANWPRDGIGSRRR